MPAYVNKADGAYQKPLFTIGSETSIHLRTANVFGRERIDSNISAKRPKPNDWEGPNEHDFSMTKTISSRRYSNVGTKTSSDNFTGVKKKQSRRHIYLGRLNENWTEDLIEKLVSEKWS